MNIKNRPTAFYLLIIFALGLVHIPGMVSTGRFGNIITPIALSLSLSIVPSLTFGGIMQILQNSRGKSNRKFVNGAAYYGFYVSVIIFIITLPMLIMSLLG